ncbi:MAG TPA: FprA family A-type flavoprotein [Candidatus Hypogeohydataceae bacterium YC41]
MNVKIAEGVYWVGVIDWNLRLYHNTYSTHHGTTYNSYLLLDDQVALVDSVYGPFYEEFLKNIKELVPIEKITYVIVNHAESDHSGALPKVMEIIPRAKVVCTSKSKDILSRLYQTPWDFHTVKSGDEMTIGKKTLKFIEAPMMHWPDNMFTYVREDKLLLSNDPFGQHMATSERFEDEVEQAVVWEEAAKYFANTLYPFTALIKRKVEEIQSLPIQIIAPSHGVIWRREPQRIMEKYLRWASGEAEERVLIAYESMWESTDIMARAIAEGIQKEDTPVKLFRLSVTDHADVFRELLETRGLMIGSSTLNNTVLPSTASFIETLKSLRPKGKVACVFGSHGWGGGAIKVLELAVKASGIENVIPGLAVKYRPEEGELEACRQLGRQFAQEVKKLSKEGEKAK